MIEKSFCSICGNTNIQNVVDLGTCLVANKFAESEFQELDSFPLMVDHCDECHNIQLRHCLPASVLYENYTYTTPSSNTLSLHYSNTIDKLVAVNALNADSKVLEIGSNNGQFLSALKTNVASVLGVDPASNVASVANARGIPTIVDFFGESTGQMISVEYGKADVIVARHMFAHNDDPRPMITGAKSVLDENGTFLVENAYSVSTLLKGEFDQIYHEHMFYFSATSMKYLMAMNGLELYDIMFSDVHGGSASYLSCIPGKRKPSASLQECLEHERKLFEDQSIFPNFRTRISALKATVADFISQCAQENKTMSIYSVPAKLFTFLSFVDFPVERLQFMIDTSPNKVGKFFPGSNIQIISETDFGEYDSDVVFVGAWNYKADILAKKDILFKPGTMLVFYLPEFEVITV